MSDRLEPLLCDLDEACGKIDAAREGLQAALQGCGESDAAFAPVRHVMSKLERIAAEVVAVEEAIAGAEGVAV